MLHHLLTVLLVTTPILAIPSLPLPARQTTTTCTRDALQAAADSYIAAQKAGNPSLLKGGGLPATAAANYTENFKPVGSGSSGTTSWILSKPLKIDHSRSILDTTACATYTELIITDPSHPYVLGSQIHWNPNGASAPVKIETLVTDRDDWLFNATATLYYASREKWDPIPEEKRDSREAIRAAGDAYCDLFNDKSVKVPWGTPCARLEGGMYTGRGVPTDSCNVGVPSGVVLSQRRYVIDEVLGTVSILMLFGGSPDVHEFRLEGGKLRYVHAFTATGRN